MKLIRKICATLSVLAVVQAAYATVLSNFNNGDLTGTFQDSWSGALIQNGTFATIGTPATDFGGYRSPTFTAINITGENLVVISAKIEAGNTATGFTVNLISGSGSASASAYFDASLFNSSTFTQASTTWIDNGTFNPANLRAWQITGGAPSSTTNFRMSFDSLSTSAIPEPSAFAGLVGFTALGYAATRRRRRTA